MTITSTDINEQSFSLNKRGYDVDEVDMFLEQVADGIDVLNDIIAQLQNQVAELQRSKADASLKASRAEDEAREAREKEKDRRIAELERQLEARKADGNAIAQALIIAQRSADETTNNATLKAKNIVQDAEKEARRILGRVEDDKQAVIDATKKLEVSLEQAREEYKEFLTAFINDATNKLVEIGGTGLPAGASSADYAAFEDARKEAPKDNTSVRSFFNLNHAGYGTPAPAKAPVPASMSSSAPALAPAPSPSATGSFEKDLSGFGDAYNGFDFSEVD